MPSNLQKELQVIVMIFVLQGISKMNFQEGMQHIIEFCDCSSKNLNDHPHKNNLLKWVKGVILDEF